VREESATRKQKLFRAHSPRKAGEALDLQLDIKANDPATAEQHDRARLQEAINPSCLVI
jgi:hypothetical protein